MVIYSSLDSLSIGLIISIPILPICLDISLEIFETHSLDSLILSFLAKAVNSPIELMDYPIKEYGSSGKVGVQNDIYCVTYSYIFVCTGLPRSTTSS